MVSISTAATTPIEPPCHDAPDGDSETDLTPFFPKTTAGKKHFGARLATEQLLTSAEQETSDFFGRLCGTCRRNRGVLSAVRG